MQTLFSLSFSISWRYFTQIFSTNIAICQPSRTILQILKVSNVLWNLIDLWNGLASVEWRNGAVKKRSKAEKLVKKPYYNAWIQLSFVSSTVDLAYLESEFHERIRQGLRLYICRNFEWKVTSKSFSATVSTRNKAIPRCSKRILPYSTL